MLLKISILSIIVITTQVSLSLAGSCDSKCVKKKGKDAPKFRDDYTYAPGLGWYKFHTQEKTWNEARKVCLGESAQLAVINSTLEEEMLRNIFNEQLKALIPKEGDKADVFLGAQDEFEEDHWVTVSGEPLYYVNWSTECWGVQPDGGRNQNCLALSVGCNGLDDNSCSRTAPFICKKPECPDSTETSTVSFNFSFSLG